MSKRTEILQGEIGHRIGTSNRFTMSPITLERGEETNRDGIHCPQCSQPIPCRILGFKALRTWRLIVGFLALLVVLGATAIALTFLGHTPGSTAVIGFGLVGIGGVVMRVVYAMSLENKGVYLPYANHVLVITNSAIKTDS